MKKKIIRNRTHDRATRWREHVEKYKASGQSQLEYCRANQLKLHSIGYWVKKFAAEEKSVGGKSGRFVAVKIANEAPSAAGRLHARFGEVRVVFPDGTAIEWTGADVEAIAKLIGVLGRRAP